MRLAPSGLFRVLPGRLPWRTAALACLTSLPALVARADPLADTLANPAFNESYTSYYEALDGFGPEDLGLELTETIEDALTGGSHLTRASLDYKRRQIEDGLMARTRADVCGQAEPATLDVRTTCAGGTLAAAKAAGAAIEAAGAGMISAVCARIVAERSVSVWCADR